MTEPKDWLEKWEQRFEQTGVASWVIDDDELRHLVRIARAAVNRARAMTDGTAAEMWLADEKEEEALRDANLLREDAT